MISILRHFQPLLNLKLLFDGLPIIQRYLSHLSHKVKVHLEASDEKWRWIIKEPAFKTSKTRLLRIVYYGTAPTIRLRVVVVIVRCHKNLLTVTLPYYHIPYKIQVYTSNKLSKITYLWYSIMIFHENHNRAYII